MVASPCEELYAEFRRLDLLLHREILRMRAMYQLSLDEFRGLYVSDSQVDDLLQQREVSDLQHASLAELAAKAGRLREANRSLFGETSPWRVLNRTFGLHDAESDLLLLVIAPEFDSKYETIYAYLNNDVTRKFATVALAGKILGETAPIFPDNRLIACGLIQAIPQSPDRLAWKSTGLRAAPVLLPFLSGTQSLDARLTDSCQLIELPRGGASPDDDPPWPSEVEHIHDAWNAKQSAIFFFVGNPGNGQSEAAEEAAKHLGSGLLVVKAWPLQDGKPAIQTICLQARVSRSVVFLPEGKLFFDGEGRLLTDARFNLERLLDANQPLIVCVSQEEEYRTLADGLPFIAIRFAKPGYEKRKSYWMREAARRGTPLSPAEAAGLASRYALAQGKILEAFRLAESWQVLRGGGEGRLECDQLTAAARECSGHGLGKLAVKLDTPHGWKDLVLPEGTIRQAHEVMEAIRNYQIVFHDWGFEERVTTGRGIKVLFSGSSGTGKTMTAGVIAHELGLDIYKIDLSSIVSKYIGETEKNLDRIFQAAEDGNAILFFDEADALFGKRSEVKDAHDRYANIEVAYLLQKLEEYEGVVILASNLSANIDVAFSRRMQFVLEFPMPDETHREILWRGMFPAQAPLDQRVDFPFLARQFALSGGDIRNVSLEAAFLAAQDGNVIRMHHLIQAMARQMLKQNKLPSPVEFKQHFGLIEQR